MVKQCSISNAVAGLKGAIDAKQGSRYNVDSLNQVDKEHYISGYNKFQYNVDLNVQMGRFNPLYTPHEFITPSNMYGQDVTDKIDQIYNSDASNYAKQQAIQNFGNQQIQNVPSYLKVPFSNYIGQRVNAIGHMNQPQGPLDNAFRSTLSSFMNSTMRNNPETSVLHLVNGTQRLMSLDMDAFGSNALQGMLKALQNMGDAGKFTEIGLLGKADYFVNEAAKQTAELKYQLHEDKTRMIDQVGYHYTFGNTPGYMMLGKTMGVNNPLLLSRFWVRSMVDPLSHVYNIGRILNPQVRTNDPQAWQKASFGMKYLLGTTISNVMLFGSAAALPSGINFALNGIMHVANSITGGDEPDLQQRYQDINRSGILPINLIYKATGVDMTEHMLRGIPFEVGPTGMINASKQIMQSMPKIKEGIQQGDMNQVMGHALGDAASFLPFCWGLPQVTKDINIMRVLRASGKAMNGDINWNDMPKLWLKYTTGQGRTAVQDVQQESQGS